MKKKRNVADEDFACLLAAFDGHHQALSTRRAFKADAGLPPSAFRRGRHGWHVRITRGKRADGRWHRPTVFLGTFEDLPTLADAMAAAKRSLANPASAPSQIEPAPAPTFAEFRRQYEQGHVRYLRAGTRRTQRSMMRRHLSRFDVLTLDRFTSPRVQAWIGDMQVAGAAPGTIRKRVRLLSTMLKAARRHGIAAEIPRELYFPADDSVGRTHEDMTFSESEAHRLLDVATTENRAAFGFALWLGLREGEIVGLTWPDVDLSRRRVTVRQQYQRGAAVALKTKGSVATLAIPGELHEVLEALRANAAPEGRWLFASPRREGPISTDTLRLRLKRTCEAAGVPYRRGMHAFRRRFSDALCERRETLPTISAALRHKHLATTFRYLSPAHRADVEAAIATAAGSYSTWRRKQ